MDGGTEMKSVAQRHQMVSNSLALPLLIGLDLPLGSRAAAPIGEKNPVEWGEIPAVSQRIKSRNVWPKASSK